MLKLYSRADGVLSYWETWDKNDKTGIVHWGTVGETGQNKEVTSSLLKTFRSKIQNEISQKQNEGFEEVDLDDHAILLIEFKVEGMGTAQDIEKRTRLQKVMDSLLGWTGLGYCDGGSIGSGTMEVCCYVIDFDIAKTVVEQKLKDSEFADYIRIYNENEEE